MRHFLFGSRWGGRLWVAVFIFAFAAIFRVTGLFDPYTSTGLAFLMGAFWGGISLKLVSDRLVKIERDFVIGVRFDFTDGGEPEEKILARGRLDACEKLRPAFKDFPYEGKRPGRTTSIFVMPWDVWEANEI